MARKSSVASFSIWSAPIVSKVCHIIMCTYVISSYVRMSHHHVYMSHHHVHICHIIMCICHIIMCICHIIMCNVISSYVCMSHHHVSNQTCVTSSDECVTSSYECVTSSYECVTPSPARCSSFARSQFANCYATTGEYDDVTHSYDDVTHSYDPSRIDEVKQARGAYSAGNAIAMLQ